MTKTTPEDRAEIRTLTMEEGELRCLFDNDSCLGDRHLSNLLDDLEAAEARLKEFEWRDISTAPKDGTLIILAEPNPGGTEIPWLVIEGNWIDCPHWKYPQEKPDPRFQAAYVAIYSDFDGNRTYVTKPLATIHASHWMPRPEPPQ